ncbi:MAG: CHAT domain-containing protein [Aureispira sp.]|nr:CHAT domain-containing protein [Aureispira sp.]
MKYLGLFILIFNFCMQSSLDAQVDTAAAVKQLKALEEENKEYEEKADFKNQLVCADKAIKIVKEQLPKKKSTLAFWLKEKAYPLYRLGEYNESEKLYLEALDLYKKYKGPTHVYTAGVLAKLAHLCSKTGRLGQAKAYYKESIDIFEKNPGVSIKTYANALFSAGSFYQKMGLMELAEKTLLKSKKILEEEEVGTDNAYYAGCINALALYYRDIGKYLEAEPLYKKSLEIKAKELGTNSPSYARSQLNFANFYTKIGKYNEAEPLFMQGKKIIEEQLGKEHPHYPICLNMMALFYIDMGRITKAENFLLEARQIYKKTTGMQAYGYISATINLAALYLDTEEAPKAKKMFGELNKLRQTVLTPEHPLYVYSLKNLAIYYGSKKNGEYDKAQKLYEEVLELVKTTYGTHHIDYASALNNLASLYQKQNKVVESEKLLLEAKDITLENYSIHHPEAILALANLADVYVLMHKLELAEKYTTDAILANNLLPQLPTTIDKTWQATLIQAPPASYIYMLGSLKHLYNIKRQHYDHSHDAKYLMEAKTITQTALQLANQYRQRFTSDGDKLHVLERSVEWTYKAIQNSIEIAEKQKLKEFHKKAFVYAEQSKSVLLTETVQNDKAHIFGDLPDSLAQKERLLQKDLSELQATLLEETNPTKKHELRSELNDLNNKIQAFQKHIETNYPKYNALKYAQNPISTEHIQELLDDETALIEYVVADSSIYLFYVDKTHVDLLDLPISHTLLSKKIANLRNALSDYQLISKKPDEAYQLYTRTAHWFYENLIKTVLNNENIHHLLIIPDGELGHLPFEVFLSEQAPQSTTDYNKLHYLVQDYKISYDYSASLWDENEQDYLKAEKGKHYELVLACAASYGEKPDSATVASRGSRGALRNMLIELPAAKDEVKMLSEMFDGTFLYDKDVNEQFFKEHASEYGIIHLAMHGLLDNSHPILSSLAFTETADSIEDDFLCAYEIAHQHLHAQLVVLSACETGYGKFKQGEGVISLARSFMYAGVPSLVVSMWEVNDNSTARIMKLFYQNLAEGLDKAHALQKAKIDYLNTAKGIAAHPVFWAPFIQLGDHHPIHIHAKSAGNGLWWGLGIGLGLLLIAGISWKMISSRKKQ